MPAPERINAARKAVEVIDSIVSGQSRKIAWGLGIAGAVSAVGALFIRRLGNSDRKNKEASAAALELNASQISDAAAKPVGLQEKWAKILTYLGIHTGYCTATDFLNPPINTATNNWLRWLIPGCGHDHSNDGGHHVHGPNCNHAHEAAAGSRMERTKKAFCNSFSKKRLISYCKGEFIGDFGAIPVTMIEEKLCPDFVVGLRKVSEPLVGPVFKWGVERDSKSWAKKNNLDADALQVRERADKLYTYEMEHFPEAVLWTGNALALNTAYQMCVDKSHMPLPNKLLLHSTSVLTGVVVTAGVVVAARALMPDRMHRFEEWMTKNVTLPPMMVAGRTIGIDQNIMENAAQQHMEHSSGEWVDRLADDKQSALSK